MHLPVRRVARFLVGYLLILLAASVPKGMTPPRYADLVWGVVASLALLVLTRVVLAREQRSPREVGLAPDALSVWRLLAGAAINGWTLFSPPIDNSNTENESFATTDLDEEYSLASTTNYDYENTPNE